MFSKPCAGWCTFSIEDFKFEFSYLQDTPQDFIDQLKKVLEYHFPFCIEMEGEPTKCILVIDDYWFLHIILLELADTAEEKDKITYRSFEIDIIEFVQEFIDDMDKYEDEFSLWPYPWNEEEPQKYDLSGLKEALEKYVKDLAEHQNRITRNQ